MAQVIDFSKFTVDNGAIRNLNELLFTDTFNDPNLESIVTAYTGLTNGKKLGYIDHMGDVGVSGAHCSPDYTNVKILGFEKTWELGDWSIPKEFCWEELTETVAKYGMKAGTERGDLQDTPYWDKVVIPLLRTAINEMFWRIAWFGDKDAEAVADGGNITDGVDVNLINICDGLWKRLLAITAEDENKLTEIEANSKGTYAEQKSAIREDGVASAIIDNMLADADGRIFDRPDYAIYCTSSIYKALRSDVYRKTKYQLTAEKLMDGIQVSEYDGTKLIVCDIWDRLIKKFEDTGTAWNNPHRALLASAGNLFIGTSDTDVFASLDVNFDRKERKNYIYASSDFGTLIGQDDLVQVAI